MGNVRSGTGGHVRHPDIHLNRLITNGEESVVYGILRGGATVMGELYKREDPFWFIDNGFFKPGHFDGYYRIAKNSLQPEYRELDLPSNRLKKVLPILSPWSYDENGYVLLCPPTEVSSSFHGFSSEIWEKKATNIIQSFSGPELFIKVRKKDDVDAQPLIFDLKGARCVLTFNSNVAIQALARGIPAICDSLNLIPFEPLSKCYSVVKSYNKLTIEELQKSPKKLECDRLKLFTFLSYCQFTLEELENPQTWNLIREIQ